MWISEVTQYLKAHPSNPLSDDAANSWEITQAAVRRSSRLQATQIPEMYRDASVETCVPQAEIAAQKISSGEVTNVVIAGGAGEGKTYTACAILNRVIALKPELGLFCVEPDVFRDMRDALGSRERELDVLCRYSAPRILVLDDLGRSKQSDRTLEMLWSLVNRRYSARRATVFTTQYNREGLAERLCSGCGDAETAQAIVRRVLDDNRAMIFSAAVSQ